MKTATYILLTAAIVLSASCGSEDSPTNIEPKLIIGDAGNITRTEATLTGQIVLQEYTSVPELCFLYGTTEGMTEKKEASAVSGGTVTARLTGLLSNTHYYYCLQSDNGRIKLQSDVRDFTTQPGEKPTLGNLNVLSQGTVSVVVGFDVTDSGGETITEAGCYVTEKGGNNAEKLIATAATEENGKYKLRVTGLKQNTTYELKAYAVNRNGETTGATIEHTTSTSITVNTPGLLSEVITDGDMKDQTLRITGQLDGDDIAFIRKLLGADGSGTPISSNICDVDLTDVEIVTGGTSYDGEHFTHNNVVGNGMFSNCTNLKSIILPDAATEVSHDALTNCTSLESITIPAVATSVYASAGCTALKSIKVSPANNAYKSANGILFSADGKEIVWYPAGLDDKCSIPSGVTAISQYSFMNCTATTLTVPDNVTSIGSFAFCNSSFGTATLPSGMETVSNGVLQDCGKLKTAYLGVKTTLVNDYAFYGCPLTALHVAASICPVCSEKAFNSPEGNIFSLCTLYVPKGSKAMYRNHDVWGQFKNIIEE